MQESSDDHDDKNLVAANIVTVTCLVCKWAFQKAVDKVTDDINATDHIIRMTGTAYCSNCELLCIMCEKKAFDFTNGHKVCIECLEQVDLEIMSEESSENGDDQEDEQTDESSDNSDDMVSYIYTILFELLLTG